MANTEIVDNRWGEKQAEDQIRELFSEDGTIYLVTGYFTASGYRVLRPDIETFLARSPENRLIVIVSPTADQFAPEIVRDLERLDTADQVELYKYPDGCLHAKLYLRTGENPAAIIGSANLTKVGFTQNVELSVRFDDDALTDEAFESYLEWVEQLRAACTPIRRRDVLRPLLVLNSASIWLNKARLLPRRTLIHQPVVYVLLVIMMLFVFVS
ncbi:phospholipase D-like domain-containing protein [Halovivax gelatinilyticus]|uniref:phospholipase D-like domain-containing protein n=1 Tax=Halovivax gelatinilyticus TaxID=2961597 RepID=UPI0020CA7FF1|nr:phospholipase D-like domain-containing protein [Halovivax gelatinilyticus]